MYNFDRLNLPDYILDILTHSKGVIIPRTREELISLSMGKEGNTSFNVEYEVEGKGKILETTVTKCKNGVSVNYLDDYMRRRDPDSLLIADNKPSERFDYMKSLGLDTFDKFVIDQYGYIFNEEDRLDAVVESTKMFMDAILTHRNAINNLIEGNRKVFLSVVERNFKIQQWIENNLEVDSFSINKWFNSKDYETFIRVPE